MGIEAWTEREHEEVIPFLGVTEPVIQIESSSPIEEF
jgi:hypothetical protein